MINKTKDLFNTASKKVADFFTSKSDEEIDAMDPNPGGTYEDGVFKPAPKPKSIAQKLKAALKGAATDTYGNRIQVYNQYLKTLNSYKGFKTGLSGRVGNLGMMSPGSARKIGRPDQTSYEQKLGEWNRRMREFSIRRYYASLGKRK
jgi:ABC-type glycerol-3-phosphate transport system substrate-binding protein